MSLTAPIQRLRSPDIVSKSLPTSKPFLITLKAAVAVAMALIGSMAPTPFWPGAQAGSLLCLHNYLYDLIQNIKL